MQFGQEGNSGWADKGREVRQERRDWMEVGIGIDN